MPLAQTDKELVIEYVDKALNDIFFFACEFLPHLLTETVPEFHMEMYRLLPLEARLAMAAPRGFAKSTLSSVIYPIWLGIRGRTDRNEIVIISASEGLAVEFLRKIKREYETNQKLKKFFGEFRTEKWSETHIILSTGVNMRARGAGAQIRGFRPNVMIIDDIETQDSVNSEEQRRKLKEWVFKDCLNTLMPNGQFIIVGTLIHPLSVLNDILQTDNGWTKRIYRAYKDGIQEEGHELWPSLWNHKRLQARKAEIGSYFFASEYMNNPLSDETAPIKENQIRFWSTLPDTMSYVIAVDPAYSEDEKADFKVAALVGIDQQMNRYLVSYVRTHAPSGQFMDAILNLWLQNKNLITKVGVPSGGTEKEFFASLIRKADERKLYPPFAELKNTFITSTGEAKKGKLQRIIAALQPLFESGKYFINANHFEAREELLTISPSMRWDDLVDAMTYAEQLITPVFMETNLTKDGINSQYIKKSRPNYGYEI